MAEPTTTTSPTTTGGDVTWDGHVDVVDVQCEILDALWELGGQVDRPPACRYVPPWAADLNCDGSTDVADVQLLVGSALGQPLSAALDANGDGCIDACAAP